MNGLIIEAADARIFDLLANLAEPTRARLLLVLDGHDFNVSELCTILQMPQSTVSRHLKQLADEGWLDSHADGTSRRYRMQVAALPAAAADLWGLVRPQAAHLPAARQDARRRRAVLSEQRSRSREFFATAAGDWDRLRAEMFGERVDLQALLGLLDERWVVGDLGCGTGRISESLAPFVGRVVAIDDSEEMLLAAADRTRELDNVEIRRGTLESLPLATGEIDVAVLFLVLHHVVDPGVVLAETARALRPGGRILIADMTSHDRRLYQDRMGHVWLGFEIEQLASWLDAAGFTACTHHLLPPDPEANGPSVFTASARLDGGRDTVSEKPCR